VFGGRSPSLSLLLLPALLLAGCAGGPPAPPQADQEAKRFDAPPPGKGALYVYRPGFMGLAQAIDVTTVGTTVRLGSRTYVRLEAPPGPVEVDCKVGEKNGTGQLQIADGQIRYVEVSMTIGWWTPGCEVAEVPPDEGRAAVLLARRIEPQ